MILSCYIAGMVLVIVLVVKIAATAAAEEEEGVEEAVAMVSEEWQAMLSVMAFVVLESSLWVLVVFAGELRVVAGMLMLLVLVATAS